MDNQNAVSSEREFAFLAEDDELIEIKIKEVFHTDFHNYVWPCARVFAEFLCKNRQLFQGKSVLELGTGTGICGIVAAKLGAKMIVTDKDEESLELAKENVELNNVQVQAIPLKWGDADWKKDDPELVPHIVIASDCFYDEKNIEDILYTIYDLLQQGEAFYYAYQVRYDTFTIDGFLSQFRLNKEAIDFETSIDTDEEIRIYKITSQAS